VALITEPEANSSKFNNLQKLSNALTKRNMGNKIIKQSFALQKALMRISLKPMSANNFLIDGIEQ